MRRAETVRDVALWALLAVPATLSGSGGTGPSGGPGGSGGPSWLAGGFATAAGLLVLAVAVPCSRRLPLVGWSLVAALCLVASPDMFSLAYVPALAVLSYLLGRRTAWQRPALWAAAVVAAVGTVGVLLRNGEGVPEGETALRWLVMLGTLLFGSAFPWLVGRYRRQEGELLAAGWERAERLEYEQRIVAEQARLRERARIAEDMHDALGHELSLIALRAGVLQVAPGLTREQRADAAGLREMAAAATGRLREIIGVLREPREDPAVDLAAGPPAGREADPVAGPGDRGAGVDGAAPLAPLDESLPSLVARAADAGLRVRLVDPPGDAVTAEATDEWLPAPVDRTAYRVVQEALTNAAKHAPEATVEVRLDVGPHVVRVSVVSGAPSDGGDRGEEPGADERDHGQLNHGQLDGGQLDGGQLNHGQLDGDPPTVERRTQRAVGRGTGLVALRERVRLVGGELWAGGRAEGARAEDGRAEGARAKGGFTVIARLPTDGRALGGAADTTANKGTAEVADVTAATNPSAAVRHYARSRRAGRRRVTLPALFLGGAAVAVVAAVLGWYTYTTAQSVLPRTTYENLRVGERASEVRGVLPDREETDPPTERARTPPPSGAQCAYYRASGELFVSVDIYRLCFDGGRLVDKATIEQAGGRR